MSATYIKDLKSHLFGLRQLCILTMFSSLAAVHTAYYKSSNLHYINSDNPLISGRCCCSCCHDVRQVLVPILHAILRSPGTTTIHLQVSASGNYCRQLDRRRKSTVCVTAVVDASPRPPPAYAARNHGHRSPQQNFYDRRHTSYCSRRALVRVSESWQMMQRGM